jgi:hypothetical protein
LLADVCSLDAARDYSSFGPNGFQRALIAFGGIDRAAEVVVFLRHSVVGVAEERLSDADMFGITDRQFGWDDLPEKMRVEGMTELALRYGAH